MKPKQKDKATRATCRATRPCWQEMSRKQRRELTRKKPPATRRRTLGDGSTGTPRFPDRLAFLSPLGGCRRGHDAIAGGRRRIRRPRMDRTPERDFWNWCAGHCFRIDPSAWMADGSYDLRTRLALWAAGYFAKGPQAEHAVPSYQRFVGGMAQASDLIGQILYSRVS